MHAPQFAGPYPLASALSTRLRTGEGGHARLPCCPRETESPGKKKTAKGSSPFPRRRRENDEELARGQRQSRCRAYREESPMHPVLALYEDVFANGAALALPA